MKNTLLTTTAIALTGFAGTASAVEVAAGAVNFKISGYFNTTAAISNADALDGSDYDGLDILTNSEIHFKPSMTLDNGITIGADIELEGNQSGDQIDESTIFAKGSFGMVEVGSKDSAGKNMHIWAPDASMVYANSTSLTVFVPFDPVTTVPDFANDADRITYFTPNFSGFQVGFSYARNASQENGAVNNNEDGIETDFLDIGVSYSGQVGGVDLGLSARYGTADRAILGETAVGIAATAVTTAATATTEAADATTAAAAAADATAIAAAAAATTEAAFDTAAAAAGVAAAGAGSPTITGVGVTLGFGAVSVGGGYVTVDNDDGTADSDRYDIGVKFVNGPMSYSLTYANLEQGIDERELLVAAVSYQVNSHFGVGVSLSTFDNSGVAAVIDGVGENAARPGETTIDGTILALSAQFSF